MLGHIISKKAISIDPERIEVISQIPLPHNKKGMQLFMGTINFVRRFVPDFAQIVKPLQQMAKQSVQFKWTYSEKVSFNDIKAAIAHAHSLRSPNFEKDFILYTCFRQLTCGISHTEGRIGRCVPNIIYEH